jgi:hypothetical protein
MKTKAPITVSTHVARDFLQNSAYFTTLPKVAWEYVSNSLDNCKEGQAVNVAVEIYGSSMKIADDGIGMSRKDLQNFFQMHGENRQRMRGKRVRGRFGTGKSAAFGVANCLRIDTTRDGKRNLVELRRSDIEAAKSGEPFPVRGITIDESTAQSDGTLVEVSDFNIKHLDVEATVAYIERHLSRYRQRARVIVNGQECRFEEPQATQQFAFSPPLDVKKHIGDVTLFVKVSPVPLESENNGIDVLSHGIWHETTLAGLQNKEMAQYLFGEVDVPILEDKEWPIPAFDNTRNNSLNASNPVVAVLYGWISQSVDEVRLKLVEAERARRQSEEVKKLEKEAARIAEILNEDFEKLQMEFEFSRRIASRQGRVTTGETNEVQTDLLPGGGLEPTGWQEAGHPHGDGNSGEGSIDTGDTPRPGPDLIPGSQVGSPKSFTDGSNKRRKGLFSIEYKNETAAYPRSRYESKTRTIIINLDHPQIAGAYHASSGNTESRQFREISYEVAAVEYAIAIPYEKIDQAGDSYEASDALDDVRKTINRLAKRFAEVLSEVSRKHGQE